MEKKRTYFNNRVVDNSLSKADLDGSFAQKAVSASPRRITNKVDDIDGAKPSNARLNRKQVVNPVSPVYDISSIKKSLSHQAE